jgi:hypothetical protein
MDIYKDAYAPPHNGNQEQKDNHVTNGFPQQ